MLSAQKIQQNSSITVDHTLWNDPTCKMTAPKSYEVNKLKATNIYNNSDILDQK